jgi:nicotinate-nucleotide pyrophosphorylase (carboxylating)
MEQQSDSGRRGPPRTITPLSTPAIAANDGHSLRFPFSQAELKALVKSALDEDGAFNDLTTLATVVSDRHARGRLVARASGTVCGVPLAIEAFCAIDPKARTGRA